MYEVVGADERCVVIRDVGHIHRCLTITNDAEGIVRAVSHAEALGDRRLFYFDSDGRLDELLHVGSVFVGFAPGHRGIDQLPVPCR